MATLKTCFKCGEEKPVTQFYRHPMMSDGRLGKCRDCTRKDVKENRDKNIDYYRAYDRDRGHRTYDDGQRDRARRAAFNLPKQPCEVCGEVRAEAHHDDYAKPLDVRWLCKTLHMEHHTQAEML